MQLPTRSPSQVVRTIWVRDGAGSWSDAVRLVRKPIAEGATGQIAREELVRYATLTANSHNTQPWRFTIAETSITIEPDLSRKTPSVDPDKHRLYASLGAATENVVQAAPIVSLAADVSFGPSGDGRIVITLRAGPTRSSPFAAAIPLRQCTRSDYGGRLLPSGDLATIAAAGRADGVDVLLITDRIAIDAIASLIIDGDTAQMTDPLYVAELKSWLSISYEDAVRTGDGLFFRRLWESGCASGSWRPAFPDGCHGRLREQENIFGRSPARLDSRFLSQPMTTKLTGSRLDEPINALHCRRRHWSSSTPSSIKQWRSRLCVNASQTTSG